MKKKWSFRSISFSKKDKNKPAREEAPKNGDVTKEEPLAEVSKSHLTLYFTGYFIFPNPPPPLPPFFFLYLIQCGIISVNRRRNIEQSLFESKT